MEEDPCGLAQVERGNNAGDYTCVYSQKGKTKRGITLGFVTMTPNALKVSYRSFSSTSCKEQPGSSLKLKLIIQQLFMGLHWNTGFAEYNFQI